MSEEILQSEYLYRGRVVALRRDQVRLPTQQIVAREIVEHRGAVAIVALDARKRVLLVRQYRSGAQRELLEIPAGTLEENEDPSLCAPRELKEETGYHAAQWQALGHFYSSPGICTEKMYLFLARRLTRGTATPEEDELIRAEFVPLNRALKMIERDEIADAKTIVGLLRVWKLLMK
ncbi:MAG: NUDIX hydrolase [Chloroflexota bacterium]